MESTYGKYQEGELTNVFLVESNLLSKLDSYDWAVTIYHTADSAKVVGKWIYKNHLYEDKCTAALSLDVDPVGMIRGKRRPRGSLLLDQYVNDRPYVASLVLSVAIAETYGSAVEGNCKKRLDLVDMIMPLTARIAVLPCRAGEKLLRRFFEPLGNEVSATGMPLDEKFPDEIEPEGDTDISTEEQVETKINLKEERLGSVMSALKSSGTKTVMDIGCGEGNLLKLLLKEKQFEKIVGLDVSLRALEIAGEKLRLERLPNKQGERIALLHGSLMYCDRRLAG